MVSILFWVTSIQTVGTFLFAIFFGLWMIWKSRKAHSKALLYYGLMLFFIGFWSLGTVVEILTVLVAGANMDKNLYLILILIWVPPSMFFQLMFTSTFLNFQKKWVLFTFHIIIDILYAIFLLPNPQLSIEIIDPPILGEDIMLFNYYINSPLGIIVVVYTIQFILLTLLLLNKSIKVKGEIRKKYLYLSLGLASLAAAVILYIYTDIPFVITNLLAIPAVILTYLGIAPKKPPKPKKKKITEDEAKFVSFITGKSKQQEISNDGAPIEKILRKDILIFISYATKDAELFNIQDISEKLTKYPEIKDVLYWEEDMEDNIFEYMNDNLERCDAMVLFCSETALKSVPVKKEWTAAEGVGLPIIPVFYDVDHIPALLKSRLGVEYDFYNMEKNIQELHNLILKKCRKPAK